MLEAKAGNARVLRDTGDYIEVTFYSDGAAVAADAATNVTVTITRADGTALATDAATTSPSTGVYRYTLTPSQTASLDLLSARWKVTIASAVNYFTTKHEIVGAHLFTIADAKAFDTGSMNAAAPAKIAAARDIVTDRLEAATGISWIPRARRLVVDGTDEDEIFLPDQDPIAIVSGSINGTALTGPGLSALALYQTGRLLRTTGAIWTSGDQNVVIVYEYGKQRLEDGVDRIALTWARDIVVSSNVSDRATSFTDDAGQTYRLWQPSAQNPSGIPEVDAWIRAHRITLGVF